MPHHHHHHSHGSEHYRKSVVKTFETNFASSEEAKETIDLIARISAQQASHHPWLMPRLLFIFAGDHGVTTDDTEQTTTKSRVAHWLREDSDLFALLEGSITNLILANVGCSKFTLSSPFLYNHPITDSAHDWTKGEALSISQVKQAMKIGAGLAAKKMSHDVSVFAFSSIGRGQELTHSALAAMLLSISIDDVNDHEVKGLTPSTRATIKDYQERARSENPTPVQLLSWFGGIETAAMTGAMIQAASHYGIIFLDDFPSLVAACLACPMDVHVKNTLFVVNPAKTYLQRKLLEHLDIQPLYNLSFPTDIPIGTLLAFKCLDPLLDIYNRSI